MATDELFIAALRAAPADDVTRLIYADWLEEHGELERANYLRLVQEVADRLRQGQDWEDHKPQLRPLLLTVPLDWREQVGKRFNVVLERFEDKIRTIKMVRYFTALGLREAKDLVEAAPALVKRGVLLEVAERIKVELETGVRPKEQEPPPNDLPRFCRARIEAATEA